MQKRAANVIRAIAESDENPIVSIHDHARVDTSTACLSWWRLPADTVDMSKCRLVTRLSQRRTIVGNESQERMGLLMKEEDVARVNVSRIVNVPDVCGRRDY